MRHLDDGTLRRLYDEPLATPERARQHVATCMRCQGRLQAVAADARTAAGLLSQRNNSPADPRPALAAVQARLAAQATIDTMRRKRRANERIPTMLQTYSGWPRGGRLTGLAARRSAVGVAVSAALLVALALTPAGSFAQSLLTIFQPKQFVAVPVTPGEIQSLPNLSDYGTMAGPGSVAMQSAASAAAAATASGLDVRAPSSLPAGVPTTATYAVIPRTTASFTFSAAKARAAATTTGRPLPPMPAGIDGSTLSVTVGPAVVTVYGASAALASAQGATRLRAHGARGVRGAVARSLATARDDELPALVVVQMAMPSVASTGASRAEIENYLLAQPGVSPDLAAQIRAIGNPDTTLPIPIPVNLATAQTVTVQGVQGLAIGDNTGIGSAVVWQQDGEVYGVAGTLPEDQVIAVADSLR